MLVRMCKGAGEALEWVCVHSCPCVNGSVVLRVCTPMRMGEWQHSMQACVHMCRGVVQGGVSAGGVGSLSLRPSSAQAMDRHRAADRGLGTPDLNNKDLLTQLEHRELLRQLLFISGRRSQSKCNPQLSGQKK